MSKKIYDIDMSGAGARGGGAAPNTHPTSLRLTPPGAQRATPSEPQMRTAGAVKTPPASPVVLVLSYFTGPFGLLATANGWSRPVWRVLAIVAGLAWIAIGATWRASAAWIESAPVLVGVWPVLVLVAALLGSVVWARGVRWAQRETRIGQEPNTAQHPLIAGPLGFLMPGLAHTLTGYPRRAIAILTTVGPVVACALVALQAESLWRANRSTDAPIFFTNAELEMVLVVCAAVAAVGVVGWLAQALDGMRLASYIGGSKGTWVFGLAGVAMLAATGAVAVYHRPLAKELDLAALRARSAGFQAMPLYSWWAATALDASEPVYALRLATAHEAAGNATTAEIIRGDLDRRWVTYRSELADNAAQAGAGSRALRRGDDGNALTPTWLAPGLAIF